MLQRAAASALSSSERQLLKSQRQGKQCLRCFHASTRHGARESSTSAGGTQSVIPLPQSQSLTGYAAAPKRGPSRRERSARISDEVSAIQQKPPPVNPTRDTGYTDNPASMGGERMGENISAGREGPNMQGTGIQITPTDEAEGPPLSQRQPPQDLATISHKQESSLRQRLADIKPLGVPFRPSAPSSALEFIRAGYGVSTPAANNFPGILVDRFASLTGTIGRRTPRSAAEKSQRRSQEILTELSAEDIQELKDSGKEVGKYRIKEAIKKEVVAKLVRGQYGRRQLDGKAVKGTVLGEVRRKLNVNGTYLPADVEKVVGRVQAFMTKQQWATVKPENGQSQGHM